MQQDKNRFEAIPPGVEPGMNFISVDFEIVMVNRTNERLYAKPVVALLGRKCYREFEKRDEPCPHCPGRLALVTGEAHETETVGLRDDGTRFSARIRAHPVMGPDNKPTGFIEVVEDITEQKRAESLAAIYADLRGVLAATQNMHKALRETLEAALRVEGIDSACVFLTDGPTGEGTLMYQRGIATQCLQAMRAISRGETDKSFCEIPGMPRAYEMLPVMHRGAKVAALVVGSSTYPELPSTLRTGLQALGSAAGHAISRIRAEQSRGDAVADLEAVIAVAPMAVWIVDQENRMTSWNKAAERVFGWGTDDVVGFVAPFPELHDRSRPALSGGSAVEMALPRKDGSIVQVRVVAAPFRDVIGNASAMIFMAEDLTVERRLAQIEKRLAELETGIDPGTAITAGRTADARADVSTLSVLIIDSNESWGRELAAVLSDLGYAPISCASIGESAALLAQAETTANPFVLAVVDLLAEAGVSGLAQAGILRGLGFTAPVLVSSDADVRGYERHGIAGVIKRPFERRAVAQAIAASLNR